VATGAFAVNPVNGARIPIWIADYVLASYGTGAVFACPAHDERDHAFATKFGLPIIEVVRGPGSVLYGTGAFVGVVNLVTRQRDAPGEHKSIMDMNNKDGLSVRRAMEG